jgi:hypothetical protein
MVINKKPGIFIDAGLFCCLRKTRLLKRSGSRDYLYPEFRNISSIRENLPDCG